MRKLNLFVTLSVSISMKNKVRILFVVSEFYQAGTQRFTFELDRALDKSKFEVEILCVLPLNNSDRFIDYYFEKHKELGHENSLLTRCEPTNRAHLASKNKQTNSQYPIRG